MQNLGIGKTSKPENINYLCILTIETAVDEIIQLRCEIIDIKAKQKKASFNSKEQDALEAAMSQLHDFMQQQDLGGEFVVAYNNRADIEFLFNTCTKLKIEVPDYLKRFIVLSKSLPDKNRVVASQSEKDIPY